MRLSAEQIARIREVVHQEAGPDACVRLFGSRLNDQRRGGTWTCWWNWIAWLPIRHGCWRRVFPDA